VYKMLIVLLVPLPWLVVEAKPISVWGAGNESCGQWTAHRHTPALYHPLVQWVHGFISGVNWSLEEQQAHPPDAAAIVAFMDSYCTNNPLHRIWQAAAILVQEAGGPKVDPRTHQWKR
jgi:hypothetical protein